MPIVKVRPIQLSDQGQWLPLWTAYNTFYKRVAPNDVTQSTWGRFFDHYEPVHALVADAGESGLVGLVHYVFHRNTGMIGPVTYLQDLFTRPEARVTRPEARGLGVGRALIEGVYKAAGAAGSPRVYWLTHETNTHAMLLYDTIAERSGFVQYRQQITS